MILLSFVLNSNHRQLANCPSLILKLEKMDLLKILEQLDRIEQLLISNKRVLNFDEACNFIGVSRSFMYKLTSSRQIPHCKPNGKLIYFEKENAKTGYSR